MNDNDVIILKMTKILDVYNDIHDKINRKYINLLNDLIKRKNIKEIEYKFIYSELFYVYNNKKLINENLLEIIKKSPKTKEYFEKQLNKYLNISTLNESNLDKLINFIKINIKLMFSYNKYVNFFKEKIIFYQKVTGRDDLLYVYDDKLQLIILKIIGSNKTYNLNIIKEFQEIPDFTLDIEKKHGDNLYKLENFQNIIKDIHNEISKHYGVKLVELLNNNSILKNDNIKINNMNLKEIE
jgi:hypothetical protein